MTTLKITIGRGDQIEEETIDRIQAAEAGEELADDQPVLNFDSYRTLSRFLSDRNLELLETISREAPASIREAARMLDRDYRDVHRNLSELEDLGLKLDERGNLRVDEDFMTSEPGVFSAGDTSRGAALVVWGIHEGRQAAEGINRRLAQQD